MVEELKNTYEDKIEPILLDKAIKFLVGRYDEQKDLISNKLKLIKDNQNVGVFLALDRDNQKIWLKKEYNFFNID